ncbi:hypothetical protein COB52_05925, partial [Candidatus Kaiserbacteria bacterium]
VWDFTDRGEGLRNTTDLRGRSGMKHGRVHWTGNFDEIQDFENDMRGGFGGRGFLTNEDWQATQDTLGTAKTGLSRELDALATYVESLTSTPESPWQTADTNEGEKIFRRLNCQSCHSGSAMSNSTLQNNHLFDVGTIKPSSGLRRGQKLTGLDTPTLKGIWSSAPYLHDGSAATLGEVFKQHKGAEPLSSKQLTQLIDYLKQL